STHDSLFVACDARVIGLLAYAGPLRPEAPAVVAALRARGAVAKPAASRSTPRWPVLPSTSARSRSTSRWPVLGRAAGPSPRGAARGHRRRAGVLRLTPEAEDAAVPDGAPLHLPPHRRQRARLPMGVREAG